MIKKVSEFIEENYLFTKEESLLITISGGADSVALFLLMHELGYKIELAHCNFNLRRKESDEDEKFVKDLAQEYNVNLHLKSFETERYSKKEKLSVQMAARVLRYDWFNELLDKNNLDYILTAHHKDDDVETFFINIIRGTGINGLSGISTKKERIIRPLITSTRKEIELFLEEKNQKYRHDSSNESVKYLRNKIRHELIPLLKEMNPNIQQTVANNIRNLLEANKVINSQVRDIKNKLLQECLEGYKIRIDNLKELMNASFYMHEIFSPFGFSDMRKIIRALEGQSGKQFFSETHQLVIDREVIFITKIVKTNKEYKVNKSQSIIESPIKMKLTRSGNTKITNNQRIIKLDLDKITFPLVLRKWKEGDRFKPLGMQNFKKISDFFIDNKYSLITKQNQWLLCSENQIVWVVGERIDDRFKIDSNTKNVYIAELF